VHHAEPDRRRAGGNLSTMPRNSPVASTAQPGVIEEVETVVDAKLARPWNVIVHDDPITLMVYVTMTLQKVFGYSLEKAQALMMEVHTTGRSVVWTGGREQAELYVHKLHAAQLLATLAPVDA
jgi:ATP-dependent Clp protease adaptor protein ClpS